MSSYIVLAVQVPLSMNESIETAAMLRDKLAEEPGVEAAYILNAIPAPGSRE